MAALIPWLVSAGGAEVARGVEAVGVDLGDAVFDPTELLRGGVFMPGFDGTGPLGQGVMTGGGFGYCGSGRGPGRGRRLGRGMGPGYGYRRPTGSYGWTRPGGC